MKSGCGRELEAAHRPPVETGMPDHVRRIERLLQDAADRLRAAGIESPETDAAMLLAHACGLRRHLDVWIPGRVELTERARHSFDRLIERRLQREPVQYITGRAGFFGLDLVVGPGVLAPRPETERLVELALGGPCAGWVCDMCTGSGAVACAVAVHAPDVRILAVDRSFRALRYAAANCRRTGVADRVIPVCADLFRGVAVGEMFSLVTVNPPYVPAGEVDRLPREVSRFEPREALDGGEDGLDLVRRIASGALRRLVPGGRLLCEIGAEQGTAARAVFEAAGWTDVRVHRDLAGRDRVIEARKGGDR